MAYNNNFPIGYQPYYPQFGNQTQPQTQNLIWVQGESAAKSYPVAPNQTVPLWDSESQTIYLKSADVSGMPSIRILDYTIRDNASKSVKISSESDFATKEDISYINEELQALKSKFERVDRIINKTKDKEQTNGK